MTCKELIEFLDAYVADGLAAEVRVRFERHLVECEPCVAYVDSYRMTIAMGKKACEPAAGPAPEEVPDELVRLILRARPQR